jgi:hypothetical protein
MRAVFCWAGISTALLLTGLAIHALPASNQGAAITACLLLASAGLMWKISKG